MAIKFSHGYLNEASTQHRITLDTGYQEIHGATAEHDAPAFLEDEGHTYVAFTEWFGGVIPDSVKVGKVYLLEED